MDIITLALAKKSSKSYVDNKLDAITTDMDYKGSVSSVEDLPSTATAGDIYTVSGDRYLYNGTDWEKIKGGEITQAVKSALLNCFSHVAWIDGNGQTYYDALYDALYDAPAPTLTSISAVYTQSGTVYTTDTLNSLKSDLVVTATYSDSSTETVPSADYTLSGTLAVGTSTITVTYQGMTATFSVVVTENDGVADGIYTPSEVIRGQYIDNTGTIQSGTQESGYFADFIPLGSKTYVVRYTNPPAYANINWRISEYDENQNFIQQTQYAASTGNRNIAVQIPISQTTKYIRLGWYNPNQTSFVPVFEFYSNTEALPMTIGNIDGSTGQDSSSNTRIRSDYIEASGTMTVSGQPFTFEQYDGYLFRCYDSSKAFVGSLTNNGGVFTTDIQNLSLPTGTAYVRLMYSRNTTHAFTIGWGSMIQNPITINGDKYWLTEVFS